VEKLFEYIEFFASYFSAIYPIENLKENESIENVGVMSEFCLTVFIVCSRLRQHPGMMMGNRCLRLLICRNMEVQRLFFQKSLGKRLEVHSK
jgi:hypothetical protein